MFVGLLVFYPVLAMHPSGQYAAREPLWAFYADAVPRLFVIAVGAALISGEVWLGILPIASIAVSSALFLAIRWWVGRRLHRLLQADSSGPLVRYYERTIWPGLLPNGDAMLAQASALA